MQRSVDDLAHRADLPPGDVDFQPHLLKGYNTQDRGVPFLAKDHRGNSMASVEVEGYLTYFSINGSTVSEFKLHALLW